MVLLLDTHVLVWALDTPGRLPVAVHREIEDPLNVVYFSAASIWEIAIWAIRMNTSFIASYLTNP